MDTIISARGLQKRFGNVVALDGLDLTVTAGEVHGFLGPNGAGKSTTIRILLGLIRSSAGELSLFGRDPWRDASALHERIAYVPGDVSLWPTLSGGEAIDLITRLRGGAHDKVAYASRRAALIDTFQLDPSKKGRAYSKGNRQKVALIAALATPADLYIFDEPTSGLDPLMEAVFRREIAAVRGEGTTVLLSSHILSEVERLCTRVSIIRAGRTVETGTLAELRHLTRTEITVATAGLDSAALASIPGARELTTDATQAHFTAEHTDLPGILSRLAELRVEGLTINPPSLEEMFMRHYEQGEASDAGTAAPAVERPRRPRHNRSRP